jgi:hypothetical protein
MLEHRLDAPEAAAREDRALEPLGRSLGGAGEKAQDRHCGGAGGLTDHRVSIRWADAATT